MNEIIFLSETAFAGHFLRDFEKFAIEIMAYAAIVVKYHCRASVLVIGRPFW